MHAVIAVETVPLPDYRRYGRSKMLQWLTELDGYLCLIQDLYCFVRLLQTVCGGKIKENRWGNFTRVGEVRGYCMFMTA